MDKRLRCADKKKKVALAKGLNPFIVCSIRGINPFTEYWRCKLKKRIEERVGYLQRPYTVMEGLRGKKPLHPGNTPPFH